MGFNSAFKGLRGESEVKFAAHLIWGIAWLNERLLVFSKKGFAPWSLLFV